MDIEGYAAKLELQAAEKEFRAAHLNMARNFTQGYDVWSLSAYLDAAERLVPKEKKERPESNTVYIHMRDGVKGKRKTPRGSIISSSAMRRKGR